MGVSRRLIDTLMLFGVVCLAGTLGYYYLSGGRESLVNCVYMTIITLSSVGYGEIVDLKHLPYGRVFTMVLIVFGMGVMLYAVSTITAFIVEGTLHHVLWRRSMMKLIRKLNHHYVICGAGETALSIIDELLATRRPFVVIENDRERLDHLHENYPRVPFVEGDAHDDEVLLEAGIDRAAGVIAALPTDKDNLFVTVTARQLNPEVRIVAKGILPNVRQKLLRAGADAVVSPNFIGGMRMVSEMIRPTVVSFLDLMLRDKDRALRVEEATLGADSELVGVTLADADLLHRTRTTVMALRPADTEGFTYNPLPETTLEAGMTLIALGDVDGINQLRRLAHDPAAVEEGGETDDAPA